MKTYFFKKLFLCAAALGIPGHTTAQAQPGGVPVFTRAAEKQKD